MKQALMKQTTNAVRHVHSQIGKHTESTKKAASIKGRKQAVVDDSHAGNFGGESSTYKLICRSNRLQRTVQLDGNFATLPVILQHCFRLSSIASAFPSISRVKQSRLALAGDFFKPGIYAKYCQLKDGRHLVCDADVTELKVRLDSTVLLYGSSMPGFCFSLKLGCLPFPLASSCLSVCASTLSLGICSCCNPTCCI